MKKNRIAAGALALALGLGAVAPAVADEAKETKTEAKQYTGAELFLAEYNDQLKKVNDAKVAGEAAQAKIDEAENRYKAAVKRYDAAVAAYNALFPQITIFKTGDGDKDFKTVEELSRVQLEEAEAALNRVINETAYAKADVEIYQGITEVKRVKAGDTASLATYLESEFSAKDVTEDEFKAAIQTYVNEVESYVSKNKPNSPSLKAYQELKAAQAERDVAKTNYEEVYADNKPIVDAYEEELKKLTESAVGYNVVVQVGNDGVKIADKEVKPADKGYTVEDLKAAKERAVRTVDAANLLLKKFPETVKTVEKELKDLVAKQEKLIETAEKVLGKKAAFISTAYAAEEEVDIDALTKELNETSDQIDNLLEKNEEVNKEANEKAEKEEKKEEEKKDEKVEEKAEEKAEKKEEEKKDEKVEEKAEEKAEKKEEAAKPAAKPAKKAGNNAKTGIAGVAGVAGILAAASVAYAASKRD